MNLPTGNIVEQGIKLNEFNLKQTMHALMGKKFSGYLVLTIEGVDGLEEGILLLKNGSLIASIYEYSKYAVKVFGDKAVAQAFNASTAQYGIVDVCNLSNQQVDLVVAFNDKIKLTRPIESKAIDQFIPKEFSREFAEESLAEVLQQEKESKTDVLSRLGLSDMDREG